MKSLTKSKVKVGAIKTDYYNLENSKEFISSLGQFTKTIFPLETPILHKSTMQVIANGQYLQLAKDEGKDEIEVVLADFPEEHLLHAVALHWKPSKKYAAMFRVIPAFMKYYSLKNGPGAKYREGMSDLTLRELVAEILGTNKTYLDMIEAIGKFKPELLEMIDDGGPDAPSLQEAFAMVPKNTNKTKKTGGTNGGRNNNQDGKKNYQVPISRINDLSNDDLEVLTENLPLHYAQEIGNGVIPTELSLTKSFTYNDTFQGFVIVYENNGISVVTHITYTADLKVALSQAA
jgi:hypothetical protein